MTIMGLLTQLSSHDHNRIAYKTQESLNNDHMVSLEQNSRGMTVWDCLRNSGVHVIYIYTENNLEQENEQKMKYFN